jgi:hypothetical protein
LPHLPNEALNVLKLAAYAIKVSFHPITAPICIRHHHQHAKQHRHYHRKK